MEPIVSIITPTYNHEKFITECIESVLKQSYPHWEMIIIDDASNDETPTIIRRYAKNDDRIRLIRHTENWGMYRLTETYNEALSLSRGDYIAILEGDDFWPRDKLDIQISAMKDNQRAILSYGLSCLVENRKSTIIRYRVPLGIIENRPLGSILKAFLVGLNPIGSQTVIIQKMALERIKGFNPKNFSLFLVDYPTYMELSLCGEFLFIPRVLGYWRKHSSQIGILHMEKLLREHISYIEFFIKNKKDILEGLNVDIEKNINNYGYTLFFKLCRIGILNRQLYMAREEFKEVIKRRKVIYDSPKECLKLFCLFLGLTFPIIYRIPETIYRLLIKERYE